VLESNGYALLKNKRVGLVTNQTGVDSRGVRTIASQFAGGIRPAGIVASWTEDVTRFKGERGQYLLY
jgi:uncharacterized protein YbbC (DUF1343 family)